MTVRMMCILIGLAVIDLATPGAAPAQTMKVPESQAETLVAALDAALASLPDALREPSDVLGDTLHVHLYGSDAHALLRALRGGGIRRRLGFVHRSGRRPR